MNLILIFDTTFLAHSGSAFSVPKVFHFWRELVLGLFFWYIINNILYWLIDFNYIGLQPAPTRTFCAWLSYYKRSARHATVQYSHVLNVPPPSLPHATLPTPGSAVNCQLNCHYSQSPYFPHTYTYRHPYITLACSSKVLHFSRACFPPQISPI